MIFYIYVLLYFFTGLLALAFFLFLLKNKPENNSLSFSMLGASFASILWCIADFLTIFSFFQPAVQIVFWRVSFLLSLTLLLLFFLFILLFLKINFQKFTYYCLSFIYLSSFYFILFTDKIISGVKTLKFSGDSNFLTGDYFLILMFLFIWFLFLILYFSLRHYFRQADENQKQQIKYLTLSIFFLFLVSTFSNLIFPAINIEFPRLAVLGIAAVILAIWQVIYKWRFFGFVNNNLSLKAKLIFSFVCLSFLPLLLVSYLFFASTSASLQEKFLSHDGQTIIFAESEIQNFVRQAEKDTFFISQIQALQALVEEEDYELNKTRLEENFLSLAELTDIYYQIRYIDELGQEVVRIDSSAGEHFIVPEDQLQNKADRYYFTETMSLAKGTLFISPLDLNIEKNAIEVPYRPVIRYATPVFDQNNNRQGIVIINIDAQYLLDKLRNLGGADSELYLLDKDGYFLLHSDQTKEWGRDLQRVNSKIENQWPKVADNILQKNTNSALFDKTSSLYLHSKRIYLFELDQNLKRQVANEDSYVIVLSALKNEAITQQLSETVIDLVQVGIVLLLLVFLFSIFLSNILSEPFKKLTKSINFVSQGNLDYKMEINSHDELGKIAEAFNQMIAWLKKSRQEVDARVKKQTKDILEKNSTLEKQEQAILNILDDTEQDKKQIELLAKDLEKFKLAVANASDHIVITDGEGIVLYANKAVEKITGFKVSDVIGRKAGAKDLWGGLMESDFYQNMWDTLKNKKQVFEGKINNKRKNGEVYTAFSSISPILNEKNEIAFFLGIERDITVEEKINQAKTEFVSLASHQLRTPLSAINWYTEMLLAGDAGVLNEQQKQFLSEIYKGNQRMVDLVNALLNVSRIELGTLAVEPEATSLADLADSVVNELKVQIKAKSIKIIKNYSKDIQKISADPKLLRILWQNLLSNAVKYTAEKGQVEISIKLQKKEFLLSVADNGYGIPAYQKDKIFTKLFRADNVRDKETDGTGLGLYIVKAIVDTAGGKIWLDSEENKGTTFFISLPAEDMKKKDGTKGLNYTK
ncbi:PAS domain S-box protein [Patescibacteria group bacterium]|nr:PAS domain S-box protein [Patescibacteria group bacterium]